MPAEIRTDHLQHMLKRSFHCLVRSGDYPKTPEWSPSIRIGVAYPLQAALRGGIESDRVADAVARLCCHLGNLREADPSGDPPSRRNRQMRIGVRSRQRDPRTRNG